MTKHIAPLPDPDGSLLLRELDDVAFKAALFDVVDLLHCYADVHKALRMPGSSSSWEVNVSRKELDMQVVSNSGGLFAGDR